MSRDEYVRHLTDMEKISELMIDCEPEEKAYYEKQYRAHSLAIKRYKPTEPLPQPPEPEEKPL